MTTQHEKTTIRKKVITAKDFSVSSPVVTKAQHDFLSSVDPDRPLKREDRREDAQVDWKTEEAKGNCIRVRYEGDRMANGHAGMIGGQPQTHRDLKERRRTYKTMRHILETGRLPEKVSATKTGPDAGKITVCGFPARTFGIPSFMDHPPFRPKEDDQ